MDGSDSGRSVISKSSDGATVVAEELAGAIVAAGESSNATTAAASESSTATTAAAGESSLSDDVTAGAMVAVDGVHVTAGAIVADELTGDGSIGRASATTNSASVCSRTIALCISSSLLRRGAASSSAARFRPRNITADRKGEGSVSETSSVHWNPNVFVARPVGHKLARNSSSWVKRAASTCE